MRSKMGFEHEDPLLRNTSEEHVFSCFSSYGDLRGNSITSKFGYPLRSALKSREVKHPVPDFSASSAPKRARVASALSQSTTVLALSAKKSVYRTKVPPRRLSNPSKATSNSSSKSVRSSITSLSESNTKRSVWLPPDIRSN